MTITEFCKKHQACQEGIEWAESTDCDSTSALWRREDMPHEYRIWVATREGVMSDKDLRLFACWCVRQVWHLLEDDRSKNAVEVAERFANGEATEEELDAARDAARGAARGAAWGAAMDAAMDAARDAARGAARGAAWGAAMDAARGAAWDAARGAAWDAAMDAQSKKLQSYKVSFEGGTNK